MITSGAVLLAPVVKEAEGAVTSGTLSLNITSPENGQYFGAGTVTVEWEGNDSATGMWFYEVFLESLATGQMVDLRTNITFTGLSEGSHVVIVRAHNNQGQTVDDSVVFYVDMSAPSLTIISPTNGYALNESDIRLVWQASDPTSITYFDVTLDGASFQLRSNVTEHVFQDVPDGQHTLRVEAHDGAGKYTSRSITVIVDTVHPAVQILTPADGMGFTQPSVTVSWTGLGTTSDTDGYRVYSNGVLLTTVANTTTSFLFNNLIDGIYTIKIEASDQARNTAADTVTFVVDTVELSTYGALPTGDQVAVDEVVQITFSKAMNQSATSITVDGITGTLAWDGVNLTFTPSMELEYGTAYTARVVGKDLVGNQVYYNWTFTTTDLGTISGVVLDNNGNPLAGVKVVLDGDAWAMTDDDGVYSFITHAGQHNLTMTKAGFGDHAVSVILPAGGTLGVAQVNMSPVSLIGGVGWLVAVIAVAIVLLLIYMSLRKKREKGPPAGYRSWRGAEDLQRRASRGRRNRRDEDEEEDLL